MFGGLAGFRYSLLLIRSRGIVLDLSCNPVGLLVGSLTFTGVLARIRFIYRSQCKLIIHIKKPCHTF